MAVRSSAWLASGYIGLWGLIASQLGKILDDVGSFQPLAAKKNALKGFVHMRCDAPSGVPLCALSGLERTLETITRNTL
jgi:hypothetical protein